MENFGEQLSQFPRILLVDDDKFLVEFFVRVFQSHGFQTVCCQNGEEALQFLEKESSNFDLAVIDLLMPIKSGWDLIRQMKAEDSLSHIPILAMTGLNLSFDEYSEIKNMADGVLVKGEFDITALTETVKKLMQIEV